LENEKQMMFKGQRQIAQGRATRRWTAERLTVGTFFGLNLHPCSQPTLSNINSVGFNTINNPGMAKAHVTDYVSIN
jgi:hypothetical protein